jgi:hypothetical protein
VSPSFKQMGGTATVLLYLEEDVVWLSLYCGRDGYVATSICYGRGDIALSPLFFEGQSTYIPHRSIKQFVMSFQTFI